jgi:F420-non-reducing hydrogenase iron-sulfur subunit
MDNFEPKIVAFCCNWCSYAGADLAGTSRMQYHSAIRIIRVMCSGRVSPFFILKALSVGADGVLILGCHPGDCHYIEGNYKTMRRFPLLKKLLKQLGIEEERVRLEWVSASEGAKFAEVTSNFTQAIKNLGPSSLGSSKQNSKEAKHG